MSGAGRIDSERGRDTLRAYDLIDKKKKGESLNREEIDFLIHGFVNGDVADYQMAAWAMAVCFQGMSMEEISNLTLSMAASGEMMDLSAIEGCKVDKHSTGGVGDKTTLVIGPIVASQGVKVAKMSGRGLGHTGGTLDKLESIPGFRTALSDREFTDIVNAVGICVAGQTKRLVPADQKLYALRDVTATVDNIPLIASSIMSKKLASGSDAILLDVKTGSGAFMKTQKEAEELAGIMVEIGRRAGKKMAALVTDMDVPLGMAVGNALEVREAIDTLKGHGPEDFTKVCLELAANMLVLAGKGSPEQCMALAKEAVASGKALDTFARMVKAQGGDETVVRDLSVLPVARYTLEVKAPVTGYVEHMDAQGCGAAAVLLGAGRDRKEDGIQPDAGIILCKKTGDSVKCGDTLAVLHTSCRERMQAAKDRLLACYRIGPVCPPVSPHIFSGIF